MQTMQSRGARAKRGAEIIGCGTSTFWRYAKEVKDFPKKRRISPRLSVWDEQELICWRDSRIEKERPDVSERARVMEGAVLETVRKEK